MISIPGGTLRMGSDKHYAHAAIANAMPTFLACVIEFFI
jgi:hypothetical protein